MASTVSSGADLATRGFIVKSRAEFGIFLFPKSLVGFSAFLGSY